MEITSDELAGVVDLFGGLTPSDLQQALVELAFQRGEQRDLSEFESAIEDAIESYKLIRLSGDETDLLVTGPTAFPEIPSGASDLPHILDVSDRSIDRERLATAAERRYRREASQAVADENRERIETLLDVSYELEAWAPVDLESTRQRLDSALEGI